MTAIVTLTTDFGLADAYVGALKGVLLARCPGVQIVDITHEVPPQAIRAGALRLAAAAPYFPPRTVHVAIVDPGVGGPRRSVAIASGSQFFVGPDNGVLSLAAPPDRVGWRAVELTNPDIRLSQVRSTFHGRDIYAPVAAHLASGGDLDVLGPAIEGIFEIVFGRPRWDDGVLVGAVLDFDRFGNVVTNVHERDLAGGTVESIDLGAVRIEGLSTWYDPSRALVAVINSDGWLEVAKPSGSAAAHLGVGLDDRVEVRLQPRRRRISRRE